MSAQYNIPLLGRLPLNTQIRENADAGRPSVIAGDDAAESYMLIAEKLSINYPKLKSQKTEFLILN